MVAPMMVTSIVSMMIEKLKNAERGFKMGRWEGYKTDRDLALRDVMAGKLLNLACRIMCRQGRLPDWMLQRTYEIQQQYKWGKFREV